MHLYINDVDNNDNDNNGNNDKDKMLYTHIFERKKGLIQSLLILKKTKLCCISATQYTIITTTRTKKYL